MADAITVVAEGQRDHMARQKARDVVGGSLLKDPSPPLNTILGNKLPAYIRLGIHSNHIQTFGTVMNMYFVCSWRKACHFSKEACVGVNT